MKNAGKGITEWVSGFSLPSLTRDAEIAVYLIHNSRDPEDYFFLFDFEEFVDRSKGGVFMRPTLRVFAGRDDFSRSDFARQFRVVFASEFDRMRRDLAQKKGKRGWLDFEFGLGGALDLLGSLVSNLMLAIALSVGKQPLGQLAMPGFLKGKSAEAKLADEIDRTKERVEVALRKIDIRDASRALRARVSRWPEGQERRVGPRRLAIARLCAKPS